MHIAIDSAHVNSDGLETQTSCNIAFPAKALAGHLLPSLSFFIFPSLYCFLPQVINDLCIYFRKLGQ